MAKGSNDDADHKATTRLIPFVIGNGVYERLVLAIDLDPRVARQLINQALATVGSNPLVATTDEVGEMLPDLERRLALIAPPEVVTKKMKRVRQQLLQLRFPADRK